MNHTTPPLLRRLAPLALVLAGIQAAPASAQDDTGGRQAQLDAARADLHDATRRVAELSRALGLENGRMQTLLQDTGVFGTGGQPRLGVLLGQDEQAGVRIVGLTPDGGADKAGLKSGDRLLRIDGRPISGHTGTERIAAAREMLADLDKDRPVRVTYQRDGRQQEVDVTPSATQSLVFARTIARDGSVAGLANGIDSDALARLRELAPQLRSEVLRIAKPSSCSGDGCAAPLLADIMRWNGLNLASLNPQLGRYFGTEHGALVLSQGSLPGLEAGDVIQQIDGKPVKSPIEVMQAMSARSPGDKAEVTVLRERSTRRVQVAVPERVRLIDRIPAAAPATPPAPPAPPRLRDQAAAPARVGA